MLHYTLWKRPDFQHQDFPSVHVKVSPLERGWWGKCFMKTGWLNSLCGRGNSAHVTCVLPPHDSVDAEHVAVACRPAAKGLIKARITSRPRNSGNPRNYLVPRFREFTRGIFHSIWFCINNFHHVTLLNDQSGFYYCVTKNALLVLWCVLLIRSGYHSSR